MRGTAPGARGAWARLIWLLVAVVAMHGAARRPTRLLSGSTKGGEGGRELSKEGIHSLSLSLVGRCSSYSRGFQPHNSRCGGGGRSTQLARGTRIDHDLMRASRRLAWRALSLSFFLPSLLPNSNMRQRQKKESSGGRENVRRRRRRRPRRQS